MRRGPVAGLRQQAMGVRPSMPMLLPPDLEFAFNLSITFDLTVSYPSMSGERAFLRAATGALIGERVRGEVLNQAGDWPVVRRDGILESDARFVIRADDGAILYMRSRGYLELPADFPADGSGAGTFRCAPYFDASVGPHDWLTRRLFVGLGTMSAGGLDLDVYAMR